MDRAAELYNKFRLCMRGMNVGAHNQNFTSWKTCFQMTSEGEEGGIFKRKVAQCCKSKEWKGSSLMVGISNVGSGAVRTR